MRRVFVLCMLAVFAAVLLCACGGGREKEEKEPEEMLPGSYECKCYAYPEEDKTKMQVLGEETYVVDEQGRVVHWHATGYSDVLGRETDEYLTYDQLGRVTEIKFKENDEDGKATRVISVSYYGDTTIAAEWSETVNGTIVQSEKNRIEFGGVIVEQTSYDTENGEYTSVAFDPEERKVTIYSYEIGKVEREEYYDENGRLIRSVGVAKGDYGYAENTTTVYHYDPNTGILREDECCDASGNFVGKTYYDELGRVARVRQYLGDDLNYEETVIEWKEDPAIPGQLVRVLTKSRKGSSDSESFYQEIWYRREKITNPYYLYLAAIGGRPDWNLSLENSGYYRDSSYRYIVRRGGVPGHSWDSEFTEDGRLLRKIYSASDGVTEITEYDEHENLVRDISVEGEKTTETSVLEYTYY
ncbi:MAG: hypothetical protein II553_01100 [Lachnospiraceae bacterium]|nr:hypothetical protein [Lachnospiraceae bacterium]